MDRTDTYSTIVKRVLSETHEFITSHSRDSLELWPAFDDVNKQYLLLSAGWEDGVRHNGTTLYLRVQSGKIYIEEDWIEGGIVPRLLESGVPKQDIVLAWQPPSMRRHTEFAAA